MKNLFLAVCALFLFGCIAFAQTEYVIPDGTAIEYIFYNVNPPYTNTNLTDYTLTLGGVQYTVDVTIHFVQGDPSATSGTITFVTPNGTSTTENLANIDYNPFTLQKATATAQFSGAFNGSLTFNIQQSCRFGHCRDTLVTVNGVHSNFTIN